MTTIPQQVATRAETTRIADHRDAIERLRLLGLPLEPPDPLPVIDHKVSQLVEVYCREWEEFDVQAAVQFAASGRALWLARMVSAGVGA